MALQGSSCASRGRCWNPVLKALQIALEDFMPPGTKPPRKADAMAKCLFRIETYDAWLMRVRG